jgi:putative heme-binding domain-containing protein
MAANEMARDPKNANSDFIPKSKRKLILQATKMIGPTRKSQVHVLRFNAPTEPGLYPYVCTFPGHWVVMKGVMVVAEDMKDVDRMLATAKPKIVQHWQLSDFADFKVAKPDEQKVMRGTAAFMKAKCNQCHIVAGHGVNLGPDLKDVTKRYKDMKLLRQLIEPSSEINEKYQTYKFLLADGRVVSGVITKEDRKHFDVMTNLLTPDKLTRVEKDSIDQQIKSTISAMPTGMLDVLSKEEIGDLLTFLQSDGFEMPEHLKNSHGHAGGQ